MRLTSTHLACVAALLLSFSCSALAADGLSTYPEILADDIGRIITAPARWQEREWQDFGLAAISVIGVGAIADRPLRDEMRRHAPNNNHFMIEVERLGAEYSLAVLGGFYLAGTMGDNGTATAVAQDGLAACLIASGMVTPTIKYVTGRSRPRQNAGIARFRPFSGNSSFPSGHATQAFALASVISSHYDDRWVKYSSFTVAGLVGLARSYHDAHFASDVLAGAWIGSLVGDSVVAHNKLLRSTKVVLLPEISAGFAGMRMVSVF